jgi:FKBP-type peptidyl-prolyl cis-trans isomerase SlyD
MADKKTQLIEKDLVVSMHYKLSDDEGNVIDTSEGQEPLVYLHGAGNIISGLEKALVGKAVGEKLKVRVEPKDAYGVPVEELVQKVDIKMFEGVEAIEPGMIFQVQASDDQPPQRIMIRSVEGEEVVVDGNHPLAGVALNFAVDITDIRAATDTEIEHGHVH